MHCGPLWCVCVCVCVLSNTHETIQVNKIIHVVSSVMISFKHGNVTDRYIPNSACKINQDIANTRWRKVHNE
jgi:hypothetical protein